MDADISKLILIDVSVHDTPMKALVDTGAELSIITKTSINKLKVNPEHLYWRHTVAAYNMSL